MKPINSILIILVILALSISVSVSADDLPPISKAMAKKLSDWEHEKRETFEKEVTAKRQEVIGFYKHHLSEVTKTGNLEGALAIKNEIERLSSLGVFEPSQVAPEAPAEVSPKVDRLSAFKSIEEFAAWLATIKLVGEEHEIFFDTPETIRFNRVDGSNSKYKGFIKEIGVIGFKWSTGKTETYSFDKSLKKAGYLKVMER